LTVFTLVLIFIEFYFEVQCCQLYCFLLLCITCLVADFLGKKLDDYVATLPVPVRVERMGNRSGLIRARLRGKHTQM